MFLDSWRDIPIGQTDQQLPIYEVIEQQARRQFPTQPNRVATIMAAFEERGWPFENVFRGVGFMSATSFVRSWTTHVPLQIVEPPLHPNYFGYSDSLRADRRIALQATDDRDDRLATFLTWERGQWVEFVKLEYEKYLEVLGCLSTVADEVMGERRDRKCVFYVQPSNSNALITCLVEMLAEHYWDHVRPMCAVALYCASQQYPGMAVAFNKAAKPIFDRYVYGLPAEQVEMCCFSGYLTPKTLSLKSGGGGLGRPHSAVTGTAASA